MDAFIGQGKHSNRTQKQTFVDQQHFDGRGVDGEKLVLRDQGSETPGETDRGDARRILIDLGRRQARTDQSKIPYHSIGIQVCILSIRDVCPPKSCSSHV